MRKNLEVNGKTIQVKLESVAFGEIEINYNGFIVYHHSGSLKEINWTIITDILSDYVV